MKICLIGKTLKHSYSKIIHEHFGYEYDLVELEKEDIKDFVKDEKYNAFNVTIPYKTEIIKYLNCVSPMAKEIGAVNTVVKKDGLLYGYNTDFYGMRYIVKHNKIKVKNKTVLVLGTGGTSKTAQVVFKYLGAKKIVVVSRTGEINYQNCYDIKADIIVNTTPVGMYPNQNQSPIDLNRFKNVKGVIDVIYNPLRTKLIIDAKKRKIKTATGLGMLVAQAKYAKELFFGREIKENYFDLEIEKELDIIKAQTENIAFIGMPGSGKTTLSKEIAKSLKRELIDTDEEVYKKTGKTPKEIIESLGEDEFRKIETEVLNELSLKRGVVISTGGGIVTKKENYFLLKCSSKVILVKRKLKLLSTENRPLSSNKTKLKLLYKNRKKLYKKFSDVVVFNNKDVDSSIKRIKEL